MVVARSACLTGPDDAARPDRLRRLYLVCARGGGPAEAFLDAALRGGVDVVQLRDKTLDDDGLVAAARTFRAAADAHGALFVLNDRPDLVAAVRRRRRARGAGRHGRPRPRARSSART